jgi:hypothetical protein
MVDKSGPLVGQGAADDWISKALGDP